MYYTGIDPLTSEPVYTARDLREKRLMKALLLYWDPEHSRSRARRWRRRAARISSATAQDHLVPPGPMRGAPDGPPRLAAASTSPRPSPKNKPARAKDRPRRH